MGLREEIMGISHLGLKTENLQASEKWYEEKLNFQKVLEAVRVMPQMEKISWMAYKNVLLELVEPAGREKEELKNQAAGKWDHYALEAVSYAHLDVYKRQPVYQRSLLQRYAAVRDAEKRRLPLPWTGHDGVQHWHEYADPWKRRVLSHEMCIRDRYRDVLLSPKARRVFARKL